VALCWFVWAQRCPGRMWKRVERSVFDQPIAAVCEHVERLLKTVSI
jgi:hypothetical protein